MNPANLTNEGDYFTRIHSTSALVNGGALRIRSYSSTHPRNHSMSISVPETEPVDYFSLPPIPLPEHGWYGGSGPVLSPSLSRFKEALRLSPLPPISRHGGSSYPKLESVPEVREEADYFQPQHEVVTGSGGVHRANAEVEVKKEPDSEEPNLLAPNSRYGKTLDVPIDLRTPHHSRPASPTGLPISPYHKLHHPTGRSDYFGPTVFVRSPRSGATRPRAASLSRPENANCTVPTPWAKFFHYAATSGSDPGVLLKHFDHVKGRTATANGLYIGKQKVVGVCMYGLPIGAWQWASVTMARELQWAVRSRGPRRGENAATRAGMRGRRNTRGLSLVGNVQPVEILPQQEVGVFGEELEKQMADMANGFQRRGSLFLPIAPRNPTLVPEDLPATSKSVEEDIQQPPAKKSRGPSRRKKKTPAPAPVHPPITPGPLQESAFSLKSPTIILPDTPLPEGVVRTDRGLFRAPTPPGDSRKHLNFLGKQKKDAALSSFSPSGLNSITPANLNHPTTSRHRSHSTQNPPRDIHHGIRHISTVDPKTGLPTVLIDDDDYDPPTAYKVADITEEDKVRAAALGKLRCTRCRRWRPKARFDADGEGKNKRCVFCEARIKDGTWLVGNRKRKRDGDGEDGGNGEEEGRGEAGWLEYPGGKKLDGGPAGGGMTFLI